ncbi:MAG TPA: DUF4476 domain-containing protein [Bacteroidia bacterium]|jgi:hypothetical protein|nr:DUF4476 domain-containing protein [Bacteroidia bacterium]
MKHIFTLLLSSILFTLSAQNCTTPVTEAVFQTNFTAIAVQHSDAAKLTTASVFANNNCESATQVKTIALLFATDSMRLKFCQVAVPHTSNLSDFFVVYDAFSSFSEALRLYDYVNKYQAANVVSATTSTTSNPQSTVVHDPVYPNWSYPDTARTTKNKGCNGPVISDAAFLSTSRNVNTQPTDEAKVVAIENASGTFCLSMAQMMKLSSLLNSEDLRLRVMKNCFARTYDQEHYASASVLFTSNDNKTAWTTYAQTFLIPPPPPCVTDQEFTTIIQQIRSKTFTDDKMNALTLINKDHCFNTAQIKTISKEFPFDEEKMKAMKMLYPKCSDQSNYYTLVDELTFTQDKTSFSNWIKNGGK